MGDQQSALLCISDEDELTNEDHPNISTALFEKGGDQINALAEDAPDTDDEVVYLGRLVHLEVSYGGNGAARPDHETHDDDDDEDGLYLGSTVNEQELADENSRSEYNSKCDECGVATETSNDEDDAPLDVYSQPAGSNVIVKRPVGRPRRHTGLMATSTLNSSSSESSQRHPVGRPPKRHRNSDIPFPFPKRQRYSYNDKHKHKENQADVDHSGDDFVPERIHSGTSTRPIRHPTTVGACTSFTGEPYPLLRYPSDPLRIYFYCETPIPEFGGHWTKEQVEKFHAENEHRRKQMRLKIRRDHPNYRYEKGDEKLWYDEWKGAHKGGWVLGMSNPLGRGLDD